MSTGEAAVIARDQPASWPDGFDTFYGTHYAPMVRLSRLVTGRLDLAEEVVQDAFIEVAQRWPRIERHFQYLRSAVINRSRTRVRRAARERAAQFEEPRSLGDGAIPAEFQAIWAALASLSTRRRAAVVLRFYEDLSDEDIASILDCEPGTVRSLVHRGVSQLRRNLP
ncbi:MAG: SigE family RNA polymerase sigma factor [Nitriliruptorales bacterium]